MPRPIEPATDPRIAELTFRRPQKLYKYISFDGPRMEWTRNLIVNSDLFFARPSMFNDPLDCRIPPSFEGTPADIEQFWRNKWARQGRQPRPQEELDKAITMSETTEGRRQLTQAYYELLDTYGIACFNTTPVNFLMWSYYAASHAGVAVQFDTGDEVLKQIPQPYLPLKVEYTKDFPRVSLYEPDRLAFVQNTLGTKAEVWRHEDEWRLVAIGRSGIIRMPPTMIDGIVLGLRTPPDIETAIRGWISETGRAIELMRIQHLPNSFELTVVGA